MKIPRLFACAAMTAAFSAAPFAQQAQTGYHTVACLKVKADKTSEFRKWAAEDLHKYAQSRVDSGVLSGFYLLRAVLPTGTSVECDYLTIALYPGLPPEALGLEELSAALKKAGLNMTGQEYVDRRNSLSTLVSNGMFQNQLYAGATKKGDYFEVSYMKASNIDDWLAFEKNVWKPLAEQMIKEGMQAGWSVNLAVMPMGTEMPYQGVSVDVYSSWDAVFKAQTDPAFVDRFKKIHPDMDFNRTFTDMEKIRSQTWSRLYVAEDMITSMK
jgi:hypothetical protein